MNYRIDPSRLDALKSIATTRHYAASRTQQLRAEATDKVMRIGKELQLVKAQVSEGALYRSQTKVESEFRPKILELEKRLAEAREERARLHARFEAEQADAMTATETFESAEKLLQGNTL